MNAYYIQDRLEAQSWARHYQQIAREEKEAELADDMEKGLPQHLFESLCIDHLQRHGASKKAINHPICVTEWMDECRREPFKTREGREITGPWQSHPKRMLRHKAMIQCARLAFGFAGIYDKDEAERIVENTAYTAERQPERDITPVNDETMQEINTLLIALDKTWDDDLLPLCSQIFRRDVRASSELTQAEAVKALGFLKQKATEQKVAA